IPGLSVGVIQDGKLVKARGYGLANVEFSIPATRGTVHQLASLTKIFTATAVMMLVEEGRLSLDSRATDVLPTLPLRWSHVTVRQLLAHTSGVPDYLAYLSESHGQYPARDQVLERLSERPVDFPPGEKFSYNQTGYVLLGMIIEKL